jgi:phosphoribosylaminoimidazolecarboxamide formyltransferase/IMP cyclohydrolase
LYKKIESALISVYHKDGLDEIIKLLNSLAVKIYSTGGTADFIEKLDIPVIRVEEITDYPSILGGRVKTLHPKVFGGILARRDFAEDIEQLEEFNIPTLDLVIVDLYPFEQTVASGASEADIIEKIDIGGISLIRATAKNYKDTVIISSQGQYAKFHEILLENEGSITLDQRKELASEAFHISSHYDTAIFNYFNNKSIGESPFKISYQESNVLRYGENPHQKGVFYGEIDKLFQKLNGKELSYNNLLDVESGMQLIKEFKDTTFVVIKHNNACGVASRSSVTEAWKDALAGDPVSAFGGVLVTNATVDLSAAQEIDKIFFEILIAPDYTPEALEVLKGKKNRIILKQLDELHGSVQFRSLLNGIIAQENDLKTETKEDLKVVTKLSPSEEEISAMLFANKIVKNLKSNTIVLAKKNQLLGMGCGQTSRVDALQQAINKAQQFGFDLNGAVMASDAFFPFPDCVEIADKAGIKAVIQPGGSIKDKDSIEYCDNHQISMVLTGFRHFKH